MTKGSSKIFVIWTHMVKFIYLKYPIRCQVILYLLINISPFKSFGYDLRNEYFFIQQGFIKLIKSDNTGHFLH